MGSLPALPTYIVLDIPEPAASKVRDFRRSFDAERASMPVEATLTGSSGVGCISQGQGSEEVFKAVDAVAARFKPFEAAFKGIERFSGTDIFYLTFKNPEPFRRLHKAFAGSGIKFDPCPFPYKPHCTLKLRKEPEPGELFELFFLKAPPEPFTIDTVSVYALPDPNSCELLHRVRLGSK